LGRQAGFELVNVAPDSPAERAGLRAEDLVVEIDGVAIERADDVQRLMTETMIGRPARVTVLRSERWLELEIVPSELG
jgi:S1-C subfamily serine protease